MMILLNSLVYSQRKNADISVIVKTDCSFYETKQFSLNSFNQLSALIMS